MFDDGAGGTNRKAAMSRVKEYVLGGGSGGNFEQLKVTGISTLGQATATGLVVSGVTTATGGVVGDVTGDLTGNASTATTLETARTIGGVSFDGSGNINLPGVNQTGNQDTSGNAATATALATGRNFTVTGDATTDSAQSFDGTGNVALPITLANSGVSAATYGSSSAVPVITVDAKGRITSATTTAVGSGLTVAGDSGSEDIDLLSETLTISGGTNLTSAAAGNAVTVNLNPEIALTSASASGVITASGGFVGALTGNVTGDVSGDAGGNAATATALETARTIGGVSFDGTANINLPGVNQSGNQDTSGNAATATQLATSRTLAISGDATGSASFDGSANATIAATLADSGVSAATYGSSSAVPVITVDSKGRITSATTTAVGSGLTVAGDTGF